MEIQFYDVKSRQKVGVPESEVRKTRYERATKDGGTSTRYAFRGLYEGTKLTKFVSREDWERLDVPEE
jgi:hypothetical protein